jgi:hypothetical protein
VRCTIGCVTPSCAAELAALGPRPVPIWKALSDVDSVEVIVESDDTCAGDIDPALWHHEKLERLSLRNIGCAYSVNTRCAAVPSLYLSFETVKCALMLTLTQ